MELYLNFWSTMHSRLFERIVVAYDADLFGGGLEPGGIFLPIIGRRAIVIGCADSFSFVLRLHVRDHISDILDSREGPHNLLGRLCKRD